MRLHSDILTRADLLVALPAADVYVYSTPHGSRKRAGAHEAALRGYGARHTRSPQGPAPGELQAAKAATYSDWGRWLAALFAKDPDAIAGPYKGAEDFHKQTENLYSGNRLELVVGFVRGHQAATGSSRTDAVRAVARRLGHNEWLLDRALFGEL